jgi:hypothetical protein
MNTKHKYFEKQKMNKISRKIEEKRNWKIRKVEDKTNHLVADLYNAKTA